MTYQVDLKRSAEKELDTITGALYTRIKRKLLGLEQNPRPHGAHKLHGQQAYRVRVGDYRILYVIDDNTKRVEVMSVAHRREVYR